MENITFKHRKTEKTSQKHQVRLSASNPQWLCDLMSKTCSWERGLKQSAQCGVGAGAQIWRRRRAWNKVEKWQGNSVCYSLGFPLDLIWLRWSSSVCPCRFLRKRYQASPASGPTCKKIADSKSQFNNFSGNKIRNTTKIFFEFTFKTTTVSFFYVC